MRPTASTPVVNLVYDFPKPRLAVPFADKRAAIVASVVLRARGIPYKARCRFPGLHLFIDAD